MRSAIDILPKVLSLLICDVSPNVFHSQYFNEIMTTIYRRFTEKEARQWRQIYKSLTLLEYLVKNGSERVVDDARSHLSTIKYLKNFAYIDEKGKDQGINVRNRAKELADLLNDTERIKDERKKAKANKDKYTGVSSDMGAGSRYGGFGSDAYGGGSSYGAPRSAQSGGGFRDDDYSASPGRSGGYSDNARPSSSAASRPKVRMDENVAATMASKAAEADLFDFNAAPQPANNSADEWGTFAAGAAAGGGDISGRGFCFETFAFSVFGQATVFLHMHQD